MWWLFWRMSVMWKSSHLRAVKNRHRGLISASFYKVSWKIHHTHKVSCVWKKEQIDKVCHRLWCKFLISLLFRWCNALYYLLFKRLLIVIYLRTWKYITKKLAEKPWREKKLLGVMIAKKILLYTPLIKWYLQHGLRLKAVYQMVEYELGQPFSWFPEEVANARR